MKNVLKFIHERLIK